jgi:hypothetical protein
MQTPIDACSRGCRHRRRGPFASALILVAACSSDGGDTPPGPPEPTAPPSILVFATSATTVIPGEAVVLQWEVEDADSLALDPLPGPLFGNVIQLAPTQTTTYCLQASNVLGTTTSCLVVDVQPPTAPPVDAPTLSIRYLAGGGVLLFWQPVPQANGYTIERTNGFGGSTFNPLTTVAGDRYFISDGMTQANSFYTYRVTPTNGLGNGPSSTASSISAPGPPEGPVGPLVTALDGTTTAPGGTLRFTADQPVTWFLAQGPGWGSVTSGGVYEAPAQTGVVVLSCTANSTGGVAIIVQ